MSLSEQFTAADMQVKSLPIRKTWFDNDMNMMCSLKYKKIVLSDTLPTVPHTFSQPHINTVRSILCLQEEVRRSSEVTGPMLHSW